MGQYSRYVLLSRCFLELALAGATYLIVRYTLLFGRRVAANKKAGLFKAPAFRNRVRKLAFVQLSVIAILGVIVVVAIMRQGTIISTTGAWVLGVFMVTEAVYTIVLITLMIRRTE
jgi:hypothetical protein